MGKVAKRSCPNVQPKSSAVSVKAKRPRNNRSSSIVLGPYCDIVDDLFERNAEEEDTLYEFPPKFREYLGSIKYAYGNEPKIPRDAASYTLFILDSFHDVTETTFTDFFSVLRELKSLLCVSIETNSLEKDPAVCKFLENELMLAFANKCSACRFLNENGEKEDVSDDEIEWKPELTDALLIGDAMDFPTISLERIIRLISQISETNPDAFVVVVVAHTVEF